MNLVSFLKRVDAITAQYSTTQLISFIHDSGRILPESKRDDFLKRLKAVGENTDKLSGKDDKRDTEPKKVYQRIRGNLKKIDSQEVMLQGIPNEEYDEWYDNDCEEFDYEDDNGISDMLTEACDFVHTSMDVENYKEGFEIGRQLFAMEILCESEYGDEELSIEDMVHHELLHCDLKQVLLDALYCAYHAVPLRERPEVLYEIIVNAGNDEITLEEIMQHGEEELPDFPDFLMLWITYLGGKSGHDADRLITEAVSLLDDVSLAVGFAKKFVTAHPSLYLKLLENEKAADVDAMVSMGIEAMKVIPRNYVVRSRAALKTAEHVIKANKNQRLLELCYFAAYESDTSAVNYIRALLNGYGTEKKREELRKVFMSLSVSRSSDSCRVFEREYPYSERKENNPSRSMLLFLEFLDGQFEEVLTKGLNKTEALGWTGTFMKQGIALYLLYLYEGKRMDKGIAAMADIVKDAMDFSEEEYQKGLYKHHSEEGNNLFYDLFLQWKSMTQMEPEVRTRAITRIANLLEKRTEGIMNANRRNYYGECAAYIAALGEVEESLGENGAKQKIMTSYKDKYTRRSAFRAEMRAYGWKDIKKK